MNQRTLTFLRLARQIAGTLCHLADGIQPHNFLNVAGNLTMRNKRELLFDFGI